MPAVTRSLFALLPILFLLLPVASHASGQFSTDFHVEYRYDRDGSAHIEQKITLTNLLSGYYASSYQLELLDDTPANISGRDSSGPLDITLSKKQENSNVITVNFREPVVGKGASRVFYLRYDGRPAVKSGQVWEITLPRLGNPEIVDKYDLDLYIPSEFGDPAYISPEPLQTAPAASGYRRYTFPKDRVSASGVAAAFGNFQAFGFNLIYRLSNPTDKKVSMSVALPPDTAYQRVFYESLTPLPENVTVDPDGNWLARYSLGPDTSTLVIASGQAHILAEPTKNVPQLPPDQSTDLSSTSVWQSDHPRINEYAARLGNVENIYNFVVSHLKYDYSALSNSPRSRKGALAALDYPENSICTEFTDLFIALARSAGIPAREINGYAHTTDPRLRPVNLAGDLLHAWPEYWDASRSAWISVDPTWQKTSGGLDYFHKFDFHHFAFVIHKSDPQNPRSAGLYDSSVPTQDIRIEISPYKNFLPSPLEISWIPPRRMLPFIENSFTLSLNNPQGQAFYNIPVSFSGLRTGISGPRNTVVKVIPPYSRTLLPVSIVSSAFPPFSPPDISAVVGSRTLIYNVPVRLYLVWFIITVCASAFTLIALAFFAFKAWSLYLQRSSRSSIIRR